MERPDSVFQFFAPSFHIQRRPCISKRATENKNLTAEREALSTGEACIYTQQLTKSTGLGTKKIVLKNLEKIQNKV